jgi:AAA family ATP:ADP antiporter
MVYCLSISYGLLGLVFVFFFYHPTIGLENTTPDPYRLLGWLFFLYVESFISLMVSLFWSFTHDITTPESAQKGYGLIIFGTQLGGFLLILLGKILTQDPTLYASRVTLMTLISVLMIFTIAIVTYILQHTVNQEDMQSFQEKNNITEEQPKSAVRFLDGLRLLLTHPYVFGIFMVIFFHEFIATIMNYQMLLLVDSTYSDPGMRTKFMFNYALAVQAIACLFGLLGTSFFQRRFGIRFCIIAYPILLGLSISSYLISPTLQTIFFVMIIAKAINYAFNQPAKEALYIPTTKSIKYKSKAWIDMFGMRFSKAFGSGINKAMGPFIASTGPVVLGVVIVWALLASKLGKTFNKAVSDKKLIE